MWEWQSLSGCHTPQIQSKPYALFGASMGGTWQHPESCHALMTVSADIIITLQVPILLVYLDCRDCYHI